MRFLIILSLLISPFGLHILYAQCDYSIPPSIKKINYADREFTFSGTTMNGNSTTFLSVEKGEKVKISTNVSSRKVGNYCPDCIVQLYWGIRKHVSTCAKSYYGYNFKRKKSKISFRAPQQEGIYFITMGSTLDYSCKNNPQRPRCAKKYAFAILKVGNPDEEQLVSLTKTKGPSTDYLETSVIKHGCFGKMNTVEWFFEGEKLDQDGKTKIAIEKEGEYTVQWSNCNTTYSKTINTKNEKVAASGNAKKRVIGMTVVRRDKPDEEQNKKTITLSTTTKSDATGNPDQEKAKSVADLLEKNEKFVLENLIFDQGKSEVKEEAKKDLKTLASVMEDNPSMKILLEGHTDVVGSRRKNQVLSEERVKAVKEYLADLGIDKKRIKTKGWGHQKPLIITNDREKGKINRRVEVSVLSR